MSNIQVILSVDQYGVPNMCWTAEDKFFATEITKPQNSTLVILDGSTRVARTLEGVYQKLNEDGDLREMFQYKLHALEPGEHAPQD